MQTLSLKNFILQWSLCREMMRALILSLSSTQLKHGILPHLGPSEPSHSTAALPWWGGSSDSWGEGRDVEIITSHLNRVEAKQDWATATRRSSRVQYQHYAQGCKSLGYCSAWPTQISASGIWKYVGTIFFKTSREKGQAWRNPNVNSSCSSVGLQRHIKGWQNTPEAIVQEHPMSALAQISATATQRVKNCMWGKGLSVYITDCAKVLGESILPSF